MNQLMPEHDRLSERGVLQNFDRALSRETGTLSRSPAILWQQLYNDLRWAEPSLDGVLDAELRRRSAAGAPPWILRHNSPRQAEALQLVLDAGATPERCVVGPRAEFVAAVVDSGALRTWDSRSGKLLSEFKIGSPVQLGSTAYVCGTTADGSLICLEDASTFRIRDPVSGDRRAQLRHETLTIGAAAVTPVREADVVLEIDGRELRAWMNEEEAWTVDDDAGDIVACALDNLETEFMSSKGIVVSATRQGVVTVREVSWFDPGRMEPFVSPPTRWAMVDQKSSTGPVVACAVSYAAGLVVLADAQGMLTICDTRSGNVRGVIGEPGTAVTCCAITPDGKTVFAGAEDGSITVWDVGGRVVRRAFEAHAGQVIACAVGRDGVLFFSGGADGVVRQWDEKGTEVFSFRPMTGEIKACAVSYDLTTLAVATDTGALERWWHEREELATIWGGPYAATAWDVAEGGRFLVAAFADGTLHLWETDTSIERTVPGIFDGKITSCGVSPNGSLVAAGTEDGTLRILDVRTGGIERVVGSHEKPVSCCHIGPDGDLLVSGGADGSFQGWSALTGEKRFSVAAHTSGVRSCAISPDGRFAVSCPDRGPNLSEPARVWDTRTGDKMGDLEAGAPHYIADCAVSPDAEFIVTAGAADHTVRMWDAHPKRSGRAEAVVEGGSVCTFTPDGKSIVAGWGRTVAVLDASNGEQRFTLEHGGAVWAYAVSPDGDFIVTGGDEAIIRIWDAHTGAQRRELHPSVGPQTGPVREGVPFAIAVSPGAEVVASEEIERVRLWDLKRSDEWVIDGAYAAFTPDGTSLYGKTEEGPVTIDIGTGSRHPIPGRSSTPSSNPDARFTFEDEGEGVLSIRDDATGAEYRSVQAHPKRLQVSATSPDGRFVVTGGDDAMLKVWDLRTVDLVGMIPLSAVPMRLSLHPYAPFLACTDFSGNVNRMELVGIDYGPIFISAVREGEDPTLRCPKCFRSFPLREEWRGQVIACPTPGCDLPLQVDADIAQCFSGNPAPHLRVDQTSARIPGAAVADTSVDDLFPRPAERGSLEYSPGRSEGREPPSNPEDLLSRLRAWTGMPEETPRRGWFKRRRRK